jgi:transposase
VAFIFGEDRFQTTFLFSCLDDFVDENNLVRVIDAFVNVLDLESIGFKTYEENKPAQRPYNRKYLLKLHIYGYMNGIRSSRRLEKESTRNIELMWLIGKLTPDHGTISNFVKDNKKAFRQILKEFSLLLKGWGSLTAN